MSFGMLSEQPKAIMTQQILRIATRKSPLALWQAEHVRKALMNHWPALQVELLPMMTSGDAFLKDALLAIGGKGMFVKELEEALLHNRADIAVHSMKDVPSLFPPGLSIAAICKRDNPYDALISRNYSCLDALPLGARVGTTSLRRQSQLLNKRPDLQMLPLRGNIHTRLAKLDAQDFDAIVLAVSGLERMGMLDRVAQIIPDDIMLPACGQGALGIECRTDDDTVQRLIAPLNDALTARSVECERHVNAMLGGNCHVPIAVYCTYDKNDQLWLRATVATPDGQTMLSNAQHGAPDTSIALAEQCARELLADGAADLLAHA